MPVLLVLVNVTLAFFIGVLGRNRKMGFWGHFFASLLLTPVIGLLLILATSPIQDRDEIKTLKDEINDLKAKAKAVAEKDTK